MPTHPLFARPFVCFFQITWNGFVEHNGLNPFFPKVNGLVWFRRVELKKICRLEIAAQYFFDPIDDLLQVGVRKREADKKYQMRREYSFDKTFNEREIPGVVEVVVLFKDKIHQVPITVHFHNVLVCKRIGQIIVTADKCVRFYHWRTLPFLLCFFQQVIVIRGNQVTGAQTEQLRMDRVGLQVFMVTKNLPKFVIVLFLPTFIVQPLSDDRSFCNRIFRQA